MNLTLLFRKFRRKIVRSKIWIQRTLGYIGIMNSAMIMFLVLSKLQDYGYEIAITKWFVPIYLFTFILLLAFGWLEDHLGFYREEVSQAATRNPYVAEWSTGLKNIEKRLSRIERRLK